MESIDFQYRFSLPDGGEEIFDIRLDGQTLDLITVHQPDLPDWARTEFHQCPNCDLDPNEQAYCPLVASITDLVERFKHIVSYDEVDVEVITVDRTISKHVPAQRGISSMMGLIIATCGCPHTAFFRPMARFHLPFSSDDETVYRAATAYLLAQYFRALEGKKVDVRMDGLNRIYEEIHKVNASVAERLRYATETDSSVNAIVILDLYTIFVPMGIETALEEMRHLFVPYLGEPEVQA